MTLTQSAEIPLHLARRLSWSLRSDQLSRRANDKKWPTFQLLKTDETKATAF